MRRVRVELDYTVQLSDDFDTTKFSSILTLVAEGLKGIIREKDDPYIEPGATVGLTFNPRRRKKK
jgi:hypothetical protein